MSTTKDITANRHGGNANSVAAFQKAKRKLPLARARVYQLIREAGNWGITVDEMSEATGEPPNRLSGRFTELRRDGYIDRVGTRLTRTGSRAAVYVSNNY